MKQLPPLSAPNFMHGYWASARGRRMTEMAPPSVNMFIDSSGSAYTRPGKEDTGWDLNNANHASMGLWVSEYNVTFFASDNKVIYVDHEKGDAVYDTGLSLTDETHLSYYNGAVYVTNPTDGVYRIGMTRLDASATIASTAFTIEDGTIYRFENSGNIRIKGTNEAFTMPPVPYGSVSTAANNGSGLIRITATGSHHLYTGAQVTISGIVGTTEANGTWTVTVTDSTHFDLQGSTFSNVYVSGGTFTYTLSDQIVLDSTSSQAYASGDFAIQTKALSSIPNFKKIVFWEEAMHGFGPQTFTSNQTAKRTLFYGRFATAGTWTEHESFTGGASGSQTVGKKGVLKNILSVQDYLYLFTSDETYSIPVSEINRSTGARIPHIFSDKYSAQGIHCATEMDGRIIFVDLKKKRVIRSMNNPLGRLEPDEKFDAPIRPLLKNMDAIQNFPLCVYWEDSNYAIVQVSISGQLTTFIWDNNPIITAEGTSEGRWLPPVTNWQAKHFFDKAGSLYGTDIMDDTVCQYATSESDDGADIESIWAGGLLEIVKGRTLANWGDFETSGALTRATTITFGPLVGEGEGKDKDFSSTGLDFGKSSSVGEVKVGSAFTPGAGTGADMAKFDKSWKIAPPKGRSFQPVIRCEGDGKAMRIDSWRLPKVKFHGKSVLSST